MGGVVWLHKTGRAARQAGCRSKRQCTDAGAPSSNREAVGGEEVGWEEEDIMQRTGLRLSQLEGWKAGRLLERNHEMRMETRRGYRGKGGERRSSRKVLGFLGRR